MKSPRRRRTAARVEWSIGASKRATRIAGLLPVLDLHHGLDPAADVEVAFDVEGSRVEGGDEIVGDAIRDGLVEGAFIAIRPEIKLQRFQLDALPIGHVADADGGKVRLRRHRTEAGELRRLEGDLVVALGVGVLKGFEMTRRCGGHGNYFFTPPIAISF